MANRLQHLVNQVAAVYAGAPDTEWMVGAEHIHNHRNFNRIVVYPTQGTIQAPSFGAQGREVFTQAGTPGIDDCIFERRPFIEWALWGKDYEQAENRLHAMLAAIEKIISQADITLDGMQERWIYTGEITIGGVLVVLTTLVTFDVITSDNDIVAYDASLAPIGTRPEIGEGQDTVQVTELDVNYEHEDA